MPENIYMLPTSVITADFMSSSYKSSSRQNMVKDDINNSFSFENITKTELLLVNRTVSTKKLTHLDSLAAMEIVNMIFCIFMSCMDVLIFSGNCLVVAAVATTRRLQTVTNLYVVSLAAADLLVAVLVLPASIAYQHKQQWVFESANRVPCKLWLTADILLCTASILNLCCISLDRYMAVTSPLDYTARRTRRRASCMIVAAWLLSAIITVPPLFGVFDHIYKDENCGISLDISFRLYSSVVSFFGPLMLMLFVYTRIFIVARRRLEAFGSYSSAPSASLGTLARNSGFYRKVKSNQDIFRIENFSVNSRDQANSDVNLNKVRPYLMAKRNRKKDKYQPVVQVDSNQNNREQSSLRSVLAECPSFQSCRICLISCPFIGEHFMQIFGKKHIRIVDKFQSDDEKFPSLIGQSKIKNNQPNHKRNKGNLCGGDNLGQHDDVDDYTDVNTYKKKRETKLDLLDSTNKCKTVQVHDIASISPNSDTTLDKNQGQPISVKHDIATLSGCYVKKRRYRYNNNHYTHFYQHNSDNNSSSSGCFTIGEKNGIKVNKKTFSAKLDVGKHVDAFSMSSDQMSFTTFRVPLEDLTSNEDHEKPETIMSKLIQQKNGAPGSINASHRTVDALINYYARYSESSNNFDGHSFHGCGKPLSIQTNLSGPNSRITIGRVYSQWLRRLSLRLKLPIQRSQPVVGLNKSVDEIVRRQTNSEPQTLNQPSTKQLADQESKFLKSNLIEKQARLNISRFGNMFLKRFEKLRQSEALQDAVGKRLATFDRASPNSLVLNNTLKHKYSYYHRIHHRKYRYHDDKRKKHLQCTYQQQVKSITDNGSSKNLSSPIPIELSNLNFQIRNTILSLQSLQTAESYKDKRLCHDVNNGSVGLVHILPGAITHNNFSRGRMVSFNEANMILPALLKRRSNSVKIPDGILLLKSRNSNGSLPCILGRNRQELNKRQILCNKSALKQENSESMSSQLKTISHKKFFISPSVSPSLSGYSRTSSSSPTSSSSSSTSSSENALPSPPMLLNPEMPSKSFKSECQCADIRDALITSVNKESTHISKKVLNNNLPHKDLASKQMNSNFNYQINANTVHNCDTATWKHVANRNSQSVHAKSPIRSTQYPFSASRFSLRNRQERVAFQRERKTAKTLGFVVGCFVVCWLPFFINYLAEGFLNRPSNIWLITFVTWLGYINSVFNPFIYAFYNKEYAAAFKRLLHWRKLRTC